MSARPPPRSTRSLPSGLTEEEQVATSITAQDRQDAPRRASLRRYARNARAARRVPGDRLRRTPRRRRPTLRTPDELAERAGSLRYARVAGAAGRRRHPRCRRCGAAGAPVLAPAEHAEVLIEASRARTTSRRSPRCSPASAASSRTSSTCTAAAAEFRSASTAPIFARRSGRDEPAGIHARDGELGLDSCLDVHARLRSEPAARVADVGCGVGWSTHRARPAPIRPRPSRGSTSDLACWSMTPGATRRRGRNGRRRDLPGTGRAADPARRRGASRPGVHVRGAARHRDRPRCRRAAPDAAR